VALRYFFLPWPSSLSSVHIKAEGRALAYPGACPVKQMRQIERKRETEKIERERQNERETRNRRID